jgi:hypothetical protein
MASLLDLGSLVDLDVLSAELAHRIEARGFAEPRAFLRFAEQILVDHPVARALTLPAGTRIQGDLAIEYDDLLEHRVATVAALGDLVVDGRILNDNSDGGPFFIVDGNLSARQIVKGGAQFLVLGSVRSSDLVFCDYNHGRFLVAGGIDTPVLIMNDQKLEAAGPISGKIIDDEEGNMREHLVPEVFADPDDAEDEWPDGALVRERLAAGLPILK